VNHAACFAQERGEANRLLINNGAVDNRVLTNDLIAKSGYKVNFGTTDPESLANYIRNWKLDILSKTTSNHTL
jgi:hypothetical protein